MINRNISFKKLKTKKKQDNNFILSDIQSSVVVSNTCYNVECTMYSTMQVA